MKCKVFPGRWYEAQDAFNKWAHGKHLDKDVIIHEQMVSIDAKSLEDVWLFIFVYHPETPFWEGTIAP